MDFTIQVASTVCFALAIIHTFNVNRLAKLAHKYPEGSIQENILHFLSEAEVVFGLWAAVLFLIMGVVKLDPMAGAHYIDKLNYTEPQFVVVIMVIAATRPVVQFAEMIVMKAATLLAGTLKLNINTAFLFSALVIGPLLGSFITEPAAMTLSAMILLKRFYKQGISTKMKYAVMGTLFVNVSIGGVLTNFAAPPVLMVAHTWNWSIGFMMANFGWKAALACLVNATALVFIFRKELMEIKTAEEEKTELMPVPGWLTATHLGFLAVTVVMSHHAQVLMGVMMFFIGMAIVTKEYQEPLKIKEGLLVGFFLAGLVTLGNLQDYWLKPLIMSLSETPLFIGATALTAVTDNAALTYLGSLVTGIPDTLKYALVAGAVSGGGLTVIANAPNPAGYSILNPSFGEDGISPLNLLLAALPPTVVAMVFLWPY